PVTLLGETAEDVAEAQRELVRVGIDRPAAMATGTVEDWSGGGPLRAYRTATFADLAAEFTAGRSPVVLDVRRNQERAERHVAGSLHIPIHEVLERLDEVPTGPVAIAAGRSMPTRTSSRWASATSSAVSPSRVTG
ncbi:MULTISPECIES: rhodanese-like domain-containing protein, partial [unclassified Blastococcus]|uniref:rhodanese-like domain-containing protein n=1 Tax=unclassified Blastococcus TaxID=2619396 RepID=UPI001EEF8B0D